MLLPSEGPAESKPEKRKLCSGRTIVTLARQEPTDTSAASLGPPPGTTARCPLLAGTSSSAKRPVDRKGPPGLHSILWEGRLCWRQLPALAPSRGLVPAERNRPEEGKQGERSTEREHPYQQVSVHQDHVLLEEDGFLVTKEQTDKHRKFLKTANVRKSSKL